MMTFRTNMSNAMAEAHWTPEDSKIYIKDPRDYLVLNPRTKLNIYVEILRDALRWTRSCDCFKRILNVAVLDLGILHSTLEIIVRTKSILTYQQYQGMFFL